MAVADKRRSVITGALEEVEIKEDFSTSSEQTKIHHATERKHRTEKTLGQNLDLLNDLPGDMHGSTQPKLGAAITDLDNVANPRDLWNDYIAKE